MVFVTAAAHAVIFQEVPNSESGDITPKKKDNHLKDVMVFCDEM